MNYIPPFAHTEKEALSPEKRKEKRGRGRGRENV